MNQFKPSNCGQRIASVSEEGLGYFFSSLDFILAEHLKNGLFIGGRKSVLFATAKVSMRSLATSVDEGIQRIVDDCNVTSGSNYCGPELQVAKELGAESFLRYLNAFCPTEKMFIYTVKDIVE